jgi:nucleoside-diphosphate-sugar epimerase
MRVVIVGATGNKGSSLVRSLSADPQVDEIVGLQRRLPSWNVDKVRWVSADITTDDLGPQFEDADVVVHLAWLIQPSRDESVTYATNVEGSRRVFEATARAEVPALVYASSVGAYSPGPKDRAVDESWPTDGIPTSFYSRHKAATERELDRLEDRHPELRVVRMRPGLCFKREAATEIRRLFIGPLLPTTLVRRSLIPVVPDMPRLRFQCVHTDDVAAAYHQAVVRDVHGAFNVAADPVLDPDRLGDLLGARKMPVHPGVARALAGLSWRLHLQPTEPGWLDLGLGVPIMDTTRARTELGWDPAHTAGDALLDLLEGLREQAGLDTPPLARETSGPLRIRELKTGVGRTSHR